MSDHSAGVLIDLSTKTCNDPTDVDDNFATLREAYNGSMVVATGHDHGGSAGNGAGISSGITGFTIEQLTLFALVGGLGGRGI